MIAPQSGTMMMVSVNHYTTRMPGLKQNKKKRLHIIEIVEKPDIIEHPSEFQECIYFTHFKVTETVLSWDSLTKIFVQQFSTIRSKKRYTMGVVKMGLPLACALQALSKVVHQTSG